jgi:hypothetical protein
MHSPGPVIGGKGSKAASPASRNWHSEGAMALSGVGSPETISGRARGIGALSAVPIELAASKNVVRNRKLAVMFQRAVTVRRALWNMKDSGGNL